MSIQQIKDILVNQYEHFGSTEEMALFILESVEGMALSQSKVMAMCQKWAEAEYLRYSLNQNFEEAEEELTSFITQSLL